jgi:hypothetical protein
MNKKFTYTMTTEYSEDKKEMQAVLTRSDGLVARSSWWGIDDGSAEAEAYDRMRKLEEHS